MPNIEYIQDLSEIKDGNLSNSEKFYSKGRTVSYKNNEYRLIAKKEREYTTWERTYRGFFGVIAIVFSLGFSKYGKKLLVNKKIKIRYAIPASQESNPDKSSNLEISNSINITEELVEKIKASFTNIQKKNETEGITFYPSQGSHRVFSLDSDSDYIFKMKAYNNVGSIGKDDSMKARYQLMKKAKTICKTHHLGLLVIPDATLFSIENNNEKYEILAERKLDISPSQSAQEEDFEKHAESLNETIRQLAVFICETGYSDVEWRNNPVLNEAPDYFGCKKIALIDLEEMQGKVTGLFGGNARTGLVGCVNEEQGNIVKKVAEKYKVKTSKFKNTYTARKKEIQRNKELNMFHNKHSIKTGYEPIKVKINELGLDLEETWMISEIDIKESKLKQNLIYKKRKIDLREVVKNVIKKINELIENKPEGCSIKGKRKVLLDVNQEPFKSYFDLGADLGFIYDKEQEKKLWLPRILNALVEKKYLFDTAYKNGYGYIIQA